MKLLTKTSRIYMALSAAMLVIGAVVFYVGLRVVVNKKNDENLFATRDEIRRYVAQNDTFPIFFSTKATIFEVKKLSAPVSSNQFVRDTFIANSPESGDLELYRQLVFTVMQRKQVFEVRVSQSSLEKEDLIGTMAALAVGLLTFLLLILFIVNRLISQKIWSPFDDTLVKIKNLQLSEATQLDFTLTDIDEFSALNQQLSRMTDRLRFDFQTLKEFTENASHEFQTPLALLQNRLDTLLQYPNLSPEVVKKIAESLRVVGRLSRLSKTLLLMTKIDNRQFQTTENVDLKKLIIERLDLFEPLIESKNLTIDTEFLNSDTLSMNLVLAEILVSNLLSNAIRHNFLNGQISVQLVENKLIVSNTGEPMGLDNEQIFKRFVKGSGTAGVGLGLALVERICNQYNFKVHYDFIKNRHVFTIKFY